MRFSPLEGVFLVLMSLFALVNGLPYGLPYALGHLTGALILAYIIIFGVRKLNQKRRSPQ